MSTEPRDPATLTDADIPTMTEEERALYYEANRHRIGEIFDGAARVTFIAAADEVVAEWAERGELNPRQHHAGPEARAETARLLAKPVYEATATREDDWWVLEVEGVGATQVRSLRRASVVVRDMVSAVLEIPTDSFDVVIDRQLRR